MRPSADRPGSPRPARLGLEELLAHARSLRAVFSDLDGTFLDARHEVPAGAAEAVDRLQATGVRFVPTTGRTLPALERMFGPLLDRIDYVACNGMEVRAAGHVLAHAEFSRDDAAELLRLAELDPHRPVVAVFQLDGGAYALSDDAERARRCLARVGGLDGLPVRPLRLGLAPGGVAKAGLVACGEPAPDAAARYGRALGRRLSFMACDAGWVDIAARGHDKLAGARLVLESLGASERQALAFGDSMNDLPLMRGMPLSVAVGNAMPALKEACAYEIGPNTELSVLRCIELVAARREAEGVGA